MSGKHTRLVWNDDQSGEIMGGDPDDLIALFEVASPEDSPETHEKQVKALEFLLSAPDLLAALERMPEPPPIKCSRDARLEYADDCERWYRDVRAAALAKCKQP